MQVIGEAARQLSEPLRNAHSEVPWAQIVGMRNVLVHDYFGLDLEQVWAAVERDIPELRPHIEGILRKVSGSA